MCCRLSNKDGRGREGVKGRDWNGARESGLSGSERGNGMETYGHCLEERGVLKETLLESHTISSL